MTAPTAAHALADGASIHVPATARYPIGITIVRGEDGTIVIDVESDEDTDSTERHDPNGSVAMRIWVDATLVHDEGDPTPDLA